MTAFTFTDESSETHCIMEHMASFNKGDVILSLHDVTGRCGILLTGEAHLSEIDEEGNERIPAYYSVGDSFGEHFTLTLPNIASFIIADTDCSVRFINIIKVLTACDKMCEYHFDMMRATALLSMRNAKENSVRLNILSKRSIRDKIMSYLLYQEAIYPEGSEFQLPISLVNLAHYICVDRSAMMREIKKMNEEHLIESNNRTFRILVH